MKPIITTVAATMSTPVMPPTGQPVVTSRNRVVSAVTLDIRSPGSERSTAATFKPRQPTTARAVR